MSLLPIIYSSILIFGGILIFVVIVSYVSYKIKGDENSYFEPEMKEYHKRELSKPKIRELVNDSEKRSETLLREQLLKEKNLHGKKLKPGIPKTKSEYRRERRKFNEKNIQVLYKEKDIYIRSEGKTHEPRFSIIKDISENLGKNNKTRYAHKSSIKTTEMIVVGANDYLRFYENY